MFFRSVQILVAVCLSLFVSIAAVAQVPNDQKPDEKKGQKDQKKSETKQKGPAKEQQLTAEQIAESVIVVYAFPAGRPKLNQIRKTEIERGKLLITGADGQVTNANYQRWAIRPEAGGVAKIRFEQELPTASYSMIVSGDKVFGIFNDSVFQPREDATISFQNRNLHSIEALLWYKENESKIELAGRDKILGVDYHLLDLTDKLGNKTRFYISAKFFRVMMLDYETGGIKQTRKFRDYRYAQGVLVPFYSELRSGDKLLEEVQVGTVTFGQKVDESLFSAA
ncbi:MAG: hypothetical protein ACJ72Z_09605 [Pyrinomonadaceae bacterium]